MRINAGPELEYLTKRFGKHSRYYDFIVGHVVWTGQWGANYFERKLFLCLDILQIFIANARLFKMLLTQQVRFWVWVTQTPPGYIVGPLFALSEHMWSDRHRAEGQYHMTPLPHPALWMRKKADMFEGNVLVKKYRGGRPEDYLKKGFALFWDYYLSALTNIWIIPYVCLFLIFEYSFSIENQFILTTLVENCSNDFLTKCYAIMTL